MERRQRNLVRGHLCMGNTCQCLRGKTFLYHSRIFGVKYGKHLCDDSVAVYINWHLSSEIDIQNAYSCSKRKCFDLRLLIYLLIAWHWNIRTKPQGCYMSNFATRGEGAFNRLIHIIHYPARHRPLVRCVKLRVAHAPGMPGTFSPPPRVSDPDMHHGTCVTHVPWCMPGSITSGFIWSQWRGKRSRHSRRMRNPQFIVSGKWPIATHWPGSPKQGSVKQTHQNTG